MHALTQLRGQMAVLLAADVDTDQIIPAEFLTTTTRDGLGRALFHGWRYAADGSPVADFVLNTPAGAGREILLAGHNFGCGSSREHAVWALQDFGIRVVIATRFADIFYSNALKNGLLPIVLPEAAHADLCAHPDAVVEIDVENRRIAREGGAPVEFQLERFAQYCLLNGTDQLGFLLENDTAIAAYEAQRT